MVPRHESALDHVAECVACASSFFQGLIVEANRAIAPEDNAMTVQRSRLTGKMIVLIIVSALWVVVQLAPFVSQATSDAERAEQERKATPWLDRFRDRDARWASAWRWKREELAEAGIRDVSALIALLEGLDHSLQRDALGALADFGPEAAPALEPLRRSLAATDLDDTEGRAAICDVLVAIGPPAYVAAPEVARGLGGSYRFQGCGFSRLRYAAEALARMGPEGTAALIAASDDEYYPIRIGALRGLGLLPARDEQVSRALETALYDEFDSIRCEAIRSLGHTQSLRESEFMALIAALADRDFPDSRANAANTLAEFASDTDWMPRLRELLQSGPMRVRLGAAELLLHPDEDSFGRTRLCIEALGDADRGVRRVAARMLEAQATATSDALPALRVALDDTDGNVRAAVAEAIAKVGIDDSRTVPTLIEVFGDEDVAVRIRVAKALGNLGVRADAAVPILKERIQTAEDHDELVAIANALRKIRPDDEDVLLAVAKSVKPKRRATIVTRFGGCPCLRTSNGSAPRAERNRP